MAGIFSWNSTASSNTTLDGINVETNMSVANVDNSIRSIMAVVRQSFASSLETFLNGTAGLGVANGGTGAQTLTGILKGNGTSPVTAIAIPSDDAQFLDGTGTFVALPYDHVLKVTDDSTAVATGTGQAYFDVLRDMTLTGVVATLATAQGSGSTMTIDINKNGTSVLSTKLTIDNSETSSLTAATPAVISTASFSAGDRVSVDVDQIGNGTGAGLTIGLIGTLR